MATDSTYVLFDNVAKFFFDKGEKHRIPVLIDFSLPIGKGEFITLFGPNGCGKSTLLNIAAGLIEPSSGKVLVAGKPPHESRIGFVFQNYQGSLLPWRTNTENIGLPLEMRGMRAKARHDAVADLLRRFDINILGDGYPYQLSGGQQQMLCIAQALISDPEVLLMDEPLNQLDFQTRINMCSKIQRIWADTQKTIIYVSHDLDEAIALADRLVMLSKRPATIIEIVDVPFPRPRLMETLEGSSFFDVRQHALKLFERALGG